MEEIKTNTKNKGGRPKKAIKKNQVLSVKCSLVDRKVIAAKAKMANCSVSEYLLNMGLTGKIDTRNKPLPKEVLQLAGTLNHTAANLNQIAKKRNGIEELSPLERADLKIQSIDLKGVTERIKTFFK